MFESQTKDIILQRMLDASPSTIDKRQGSVTYDLLAPAAIELAQSYIAIENALDLSFADTSGGEYLDKRANEFGVVRKPAVKSTGDVKLSGDNGVVVVAGTIIATEEGIRFITDESVTIANGTATVSATAEVGGTAGNVAISDINTVIGNLSGVVTVTNENTFTGGIDTESDEALLARYLEKVRKPATSGNIDNYKQWALSITGVGKANVYPTWDGAGTVKIVLLNSDFRTPTSAIINNVANYIETVRPIGATVTVAGATEVPINVSFNLQYAAGYTQAQVIQNISESISEYLKTLAFMDTTVRYSRILNSAIDAEGVVDVQNLTLNGTTSNATVQSGSVAVIGTVTAVA